MDINFPIAFWFAISSFKRLDGDYGARDEVVQRPAELVHAAIRSNASRTYDIQKVAMNDCARCDSFAAPCLCVRVGCRSPSENMQARARLLKGCNCNGKRDA